MKKTSGKMKTLVLIDAHAVIHRAYHALPDFLSSRGEPTGALYGLSSFLIKLIGDLTPDFIVACYDLPGPTYRHEAYEKYKATRAKTDDLLVAQLERSRAVFEAFGIPIYDAPGFEADDMLGTIAEQMKSDPTLTVIIASGDMDALQLVDDERVRVYTLKKGITESVFYDEEAVVKRFGFPPKFLPDYKGFRGDPSDNIIGVAGVGEKTATALIREFGTVEEVYRALKKKDDARFKKAGITPRIIEILRSNEEEALFSKMLATISRDAPISFVLPEKPFLEGLDAERVATLFAEFEFRTLTPRLRALLSKKAVHAENEAPTTAALLEPSPHIPHAELRRVAVALWLVRSDITEPALEDVLQYAKTKDFEAAKKKIFADLRAAGLEKVYKDIEEPLIPIVAAMERRGVRIDTKYLATLSKEYHAHLSALEKKIYALAGEEFNINSPKQLGAVLFEKLDLNLKNHKKTSTGVKSTRESELEKLRALHPIIGLILDYRELQKLLSTYIDTIPTTIDASGRLHARFLQAGTTTGRMSSSDPNLQNIPIRTELGRKIRNAFTADEGFSILSLDYSQIDLRVAAFLSGDKKLVSIFKDGKDIHAAVAAEVFNVPLAKVDAEMRRRAKVINFGILYGMGVNALRANLGTTRAEAQLFYDEYFKEFSGLAGYLERTKAEASRQGYTTTFFGRRRYFEGIRSSLPFVRAQAERMAINAPIQGTQADIIKLAMVRAHESLHAEGLENDAHLLMQVHDELVYEVKSSKVEKIARSIKGIMEGVLSLKETRGIALSAAASAGPSWGELTKLTL